MADLFAVDTVSGKVYELTATRNAVELLPSLFPPRPLAMAGFRESVPGLWEITAKDADGVTWPVTLNEDGTLTAHIRDDLVNLTTHGDIRIPSLPSPYEPE